MALSTPFTCSNGHSFTANAKLRARCPECGVVARKDFHAAPKEEIKPELESNKEPNIEPTPKVKTEPQKSIKVLRRGRHSPPPKEKPMPEKLHAKVSLPKKKGLVSHKKLKRAAVPVVRGRPTGNREHKVAANVGEGKSFQDHVVEKYGLF